MVKHNNVVPNGHFKKWEKYAKTWFNQPARKSRRRIGGKELAKANRRPIVHGQTTKYKMKLKAGKRISPEELKAAGISKKLAPTMVIAVDCRRRTSPYHLNVANVRIAGF